jgi:hypothetical protein
VEGKSEKFLNRKILIRSIEGHATFSHKRSSPRWTLQEWEEELKYLSGWQDNSFWL